MGKPETAKKYLEGGIRTRGSQGPDDSQGRGAHMEQEHGAFKVNPPVAQFTAGRAGWKCLRLDRLVARNLYRREHLVIIYADDQRCINKTAFKSGSRNTIRAGEEISPNKSVN